ncbi:unnamed protein product [Pylaiella littoralis]
MTEEGTFIINGYERIVISQIIRSPGLYFRKELITPRKTIYTATLISDKGLWTNLESKEKKEDLDQDKIFFTIYWIIIKYHQRNIRQYKASLLFEAQQLTQESKKAANFYLKRKT